MADHSPILIGHTPPTLAPDTESGEELEAISKELSAGKGRRLSEEMLHRLRSSGWLGQEKWTRGSYYTTSGLRKATGNPELVLLNVPGVFAPAAQRLLNDICDYLLASGARVRPGEAFELTHPQFPSMQVTFDLLEPGDMQGPEFRQPMLLVIPLP